MIYSLLKALNFSASVSMGANSWFTQLTKFFAMHMAKLQISHTVVLSLHCDWLFTVQHVT